MSRVEDDQGRVRCRDCGEFKHPDKMKGPKSGRNKCDTICKQCKNRRDRNSPAGKERQLRARAWHRRYTLARNRTYVQLARNHPEEFERLFAIAWREAGTDEMLGWVIIPEHKRRLFGHPGHETTPRLEDTCVT